MKSELIAVTEKSMIEIARYLRRMKATLIRAVPRKVPTEHGEEDAYMILYIGG